MELAVSTHYAINNMEEFNEPQKIAILWLLNEVMNADNIIHENEVAYYNHVQTSLGLSDSVLDQVSSIRPFDALATIKEMTNNQKGQIARLMGNMIVVDEDINYNEVKLYNNVCQFCGINQNFDFNEYSDCTLSGPFDDLQIK
jgi:uncharacterized tellurite resistance protein B-like protein